VYAVLDGSANEPDGTRMGGVIDDALKRNEHCGEFFLSLAASLDLMRRFPAAADYYAQARRRMPQLMGVRGRLGMLYMRLGREDEAKPLLKASFEIDPFNVRVKNMLAVLDVLDGYQTLETEHFLIRFDRNYDALLAKSAAKYLEEEVYQQICDQLGYEPTQKSLFEIFNRAKNTDGHGWFSARMVGLPYIGTVGACAGQMVAMASPNGLPRKYNWARVLRHEFVHVVNLQQTDFNIPHWFTEALAVHLEGCPRPPEWTAVLAKRFRAGQLFDLGTLNRGFVRPANGEDWTLAYCQAELYAEYMIDRFGEDAAAKLIAAYEQHRSTEDAIDVAFSVSLEDFEQGYYEHVTKVVGDVAGREPPKSQTLAELQQAQRRQPEDADVAARLALAYLKRKANTDARRYALEAMKLRPQHQLAAYVLARLYLSIGEARRAEAALAACLADDARGDEPPQENALALLAALRLKAEDYAGAARWYRLGRRHYPHEVKWLKALANVHLKANKDLPLEKALEELAQLDADDVTLRKKLVQLTLARKDFPAAAKWANQALHIDVMDAQLHAWLAEACMGQKQWAAAIEQYEVAMELAPMQLAWRLALADAHVQANQLEQARAVLKELLNIAPSYPGADVLLESLQP
jgi:tetratricopeptide (TPR) repeat protein